MRRCKCKKCGNLRRAHTNGHYCYYVGEDGARYSQLLPSLSKARDKLRADLHPDSEIIRVWVMKTSGNKQYDIVREGKWVSHTEGYYGVHSGMNDNE